MNKVKSAKLTWIHIFTYLFLTLIAYRKIFISDLAIGHNWDWIVPYFSQQLLQLQKYGTYIWYEYALGNSASIAQTSSILQLLAAGFGKLGLTGAAFSKAIVFYVSFFSATFFYLFVKEFLNYFSDKSPDKDSISWASFLAGLFFGFTPFLFNELNGGASSKLFSYPMAPLFLLFASKYLLGKKYVVFELPISALVLLLVSTAFQNLVLTSAFIFFLTIYYCIINKSFVPFYKLITIYILFTLLSAFWLFPLLATYNYAVSEFIQKDLFNVSTLKYNVPYWYEIIMGAGYFREFFTFSSATFIRPILFLFGYAMLALIIYAYFLARSKGFKYIFTMLFFITYYLVSIIPAVGGREPFGAITIFLYKHISLLNLFRSPQHWIFQICLVLSFLVGLSTYIVLQDISSKNKKPFLIGFIIIELVFLNGFFIRGDISSGHFKTFRSAGNFVDLFKYPDSYAALIDKVNLDKSSTNAAFFPSGFSPYYMKNEYQYYGQGGDPLLLSFPKPYVANTFIRSESTSRLIAGLEDKINTVGLTDLTYKYLSFLGIKYIILRDDVIVNFGDYSLLDTYDKVRASLDSKLNGNDYDYLRLYQIEPSARIYASNNPKYLSNSYIDELNFDQIMQLTSDDSVLVQSNNLAEDNLINSYVMPQNSYSDEIHFEVKSSGNYYVDIPTDVRLNLKNTIKVKQIECTDYENQIADTKEYAFNLMVQSGVYLEKGCYIFDVSDVNKLNIQTVDKEITLPVVEKLNLEKDIALYQFPDNDWNHAYSIDLNYSSVSGKQLEVYVWVKICGDPRTHVIQNDSNICIYDIQPVKNSSISDLHVKENFNISGNRLYSDKGIGFFSSEPVKLTGLNLYQVINPITSLHMQNYEVNDQKYIPVEFSRINPTKYLVHVDDNQKDSFVLFFGQNFDDGWRISPTKDYKFGNEIYDYTTYNSVEKNSFCNKCSWLNTMFMPQNNHVMVNGYANGWIMDPKDSNYSSDFLIEFYPQQFYVLGVYISVTLLVSSFAIVFIWRKKQ